MSKLKIGCGCLSQCSLSSLFTSKGHGSVYPSPLYPYPCDAKEEPRSPLKLFYVRLNESTCSACRCVFKIRFTIKKL